MCYFFLCEKTTQKKIRKKKLPDAFWWELVKDITGNVLGEKILQNKWFQKNCFFSFMDLFQIVFHEL